MVEVVLRQTVEGDSAIPVEQMWHHEGDDKPNGFACERNLTIKGKRQTCRIRRTSFQSSSSKISMSTSIGRSTSWANDTRCDRSCMTCIDSFNESQPQGLTVKNCQAMCVCLLKTPKVPIVPISTLANAMTRKRKFMSMEATAKLNQVSNPSKISYVPRVIVQESGFNASEKEPQCHHVTLLLLSSDITLSPDQGLDHYYCSQRV